MDCDTIIKSEDIFDYIVEESRPADTKGYECIEIADAYWRIIHSNLEEERKYLAIPKLYGLMQENVDTSSLEAVGATQILNQPIINVRGQGVIIGFVDTGIDFLKENFMDSAGFSRIGAIWDQTAEYNSDNNGVVVNYGHVFYQDEINMAIKQSRNGLNPYDYVSQVDEIGHGTAMAGISASSEVGGYYGVSPESTIAMVKLKPAKKYLRDFYLINEDTAAYQENDIMMGIKFLLDYAEYMKLPIVIVIGLGSGMGPRTGTSPLADMMNTAAKRQRVSVVTCVGNEGNERTHFRALMDSYNEYEEIEVNVEKTGKGFVMEIWAESLDILSVSIESPSGESVPRIPAKMGMEVTYPFLYENSQVSVEYRVPEERSGLENIFIRFMNAAVGIWKVRVYSLTNIKGYFNAWLPLKQFMDSQVFFLKSDPDITISEQSAAARVISVGAYNHYTGGTYYESGRGYTVDGRIKPDIIAPGVEVYVLSNKRGYTRLTGSSMSAAHVAGAAALLFCWGITMGNAVSISNNDIKVALIRGATKTENISYPNRISGYGKLSIYNTFNQIRIS